MRRMAALVLATALALAGCGNDDDSGGTSGGDTTTSADGGGGETMAAELTTAAESGLDLPDVVPGEFPIPADAEVTRNQETDSGLLQVFLGTQADRPSLAAAYTAWAESLDGFIDEDLGSYSVTYPGDGDSTVGVAVAISTCEGDEETCPHPTTVNVTIQQN